MTWFSHKILSGSLVYAATGSNVAAFFAALGSVLPDAMEGFPNTGNYRTWRKKHRQLTHWFVPYIVVVVILFFFANSQGVQYMAPSKILRILRFSSNIQYSLIAYIFGFFAFGAFLHCFEDALCGTIPALNPSSRFGIKLFPVRSPMEYFLVGVTSLLLILFRFKTGSF